MGPKYVFRHLLREKDKIGNNSAATKAKEKISTDLESVQFHLNFYVCSTKYKNNQILLNKISDIFNTTKTHETF
jgi:hypothetical protein